MKDILFLFPLFYASNSVTRFAQYLREEKSPYTFNVYMSCSNSAIFNDAIEKANQEGFLCDLRPNCGGGEGALWWLQKKSNISLSNYRYIWYIEESCEPVRSGWIRRIINDMDNGVPLAGWWWSPEGRKRPHAITHEVVGANGNRMIYYENTQATGLDPEGNPLWKMYDTPCYRDETFVVHTDDFLAFHYPDVTDPFWEKRNGVRGYGIRAERFWWKIEDVAYHGIPFPSPNIQWYVLTKYNYVPSPQNVYRSYFRELPIARRKDETYWPKPIVKRRMENILINIRKKISLLPDWVETNLPR